MMDKNFEPKVVARASQAAEGLCKWIRAMVLYDQVAKIVTPKKVKLVAAERDYENTLTFLLERRQTLVKLNEKLDMLRKNLQETMTKKIHLENEVGSFLSILFSYSLFCLLSFLFLIFSFYSFLSISIFSYFSLSFSSSFLTILFLFKYLFLLKIILKNCIVKYTIIISFFTIYYYCLIKFYY